MPIFDSVERLRSGKKCKIAIKVNKSEGNVSESSPIMSAPDGKVYNESEARLKIQKEVDGRCADKKLHCPTD